MKALRFGLLCLVLLTGSCSSSCEDVDWRNDQFIGTWSGIISVQGELEACPYDAGDGKTAQLAIRHGVSVHEPSGYLGNTVTVADARGREYEGLFVSKSEFYASYTDPQDYTRHIGLHYTLTDSSTATLEQVYDVARPGGCKTVYIGVMHKE